MVSKLKENKNIFLFLFASIHIDSLCSKLNYKHEYFYSGINPVEFRGHELMKCLHLIFRLQKECPWNSSVAWMVSQCPQCSGSWTTKRSATETSISYIPISTTSFSSFQSAKLSWVARFPSGPATPSEAPKALVCWRWKVSYVAQCLKFFGFIVAWLNHIVNWNIMLKQLNYRTSIGTI